jgi:hypothetical protein
MSSLSNEQFNTKSLTGLSDTFSSNIVCDTFECIQEFTIDPGCVINLPANSIPDPALSTNVAFRNQNNTFSLTNIFSSIVQFTSTTIPVITQSISLADNSTKISTTAFVKGQNYITAAALTPYALLAGTQTFTGTNTFSGVSNINNTAFYNNSTDARFVSPTGESTQMFQTAVGFGIISISNGKYIALNTKDATGATTVAGVFCQNANQSYLQSNTNTVNRIDITGNQATIGGVNVPVITTQPLNASNNNEIASTAFVKGQNYITAAALTPYAQLAASQTFTGINTFSNNINLNATAFYNNSTDARFVSPTGEATQMFQTSVGFGIISISNGKYIALNTKDATGATTVAGVFCQNANQAYLQGTLNNRIDITNGQATIGGTSVPVITTQPLTSSNNNEIASTAFVKNQGYITSSALTPYALLDPPALQTWGTNENQFNTQVTMNVVGTRYLNGANSSSITQTGNNLILANISNSNSIQLRTNNSIGVFSQNVLARNGNEIAIKGDAGIVRVLNTACTIECGTFSSEAPYNCGYLTIGAPITSKTNYNIGFVWDIGGASFTGTSWATAVGAYNIMTIAWNNTGNYTLGVWLCDIVIIINLTSPCNFSLCWNTISNTSMDITENCAQSTAATVFNATGQQITRLSFVLNITNFLGNYWLNSSRTGGAGLSSNTSFSRIRFTRIA